MSNLFFIRKRTEKRTLILLLGLLISFAAVQLLSCRETYADSGYNTVKSYSVNGTKFSNLYSALASAIPNRSDVTITTTYVPYDNPTATESQAVEIPSNSETISGSNTVSKAASLLPTQETEIIHSSYFSGEIYSSSISFHFMNNFMTLQTVMEHLRSVDLVAYNGSQQSTGGGQNQGNPYSTGYSTGGYNTAPYGPGYAPMYDDPSLGSYYDGAPMESTINRGQQANYGDPGTLIYSAWLTGLWGDGKIEERKGSAGYETDRAGLLAGLDLFGCTDCRSGLFYSFQENKLKGYTDYYGKSKTEQHMLGLYHQFGDEVIYNIFTLRGQYSKYKTDRTISAANINETLKNSTDYYDAGINYERGMNFCFGDAFKITPYAGIDFEYLYRDKINETSDGSSAYGLSAAKEDYYSLRSTVGAKASLSMFPGTQEIKISVGGNWSHEFLDKLEGNTNFYFNGNSNAVYTLTGNTLGRDWGLIGAGVDWVPVPAVVIFANYDYIKNKYVRYNNAYLGGRVRW